MKTFWRSWKKEQEKTLKKTPYKLVNKYLYYLCMIYFIVKVVLIIGIIIILYPYLKSYFNLFIEKTPEIINFLNNTI